MTKSRNGFDRALDTVWLIWVACLPLGHLTGAHNTLSVLVILATLVRTRGEGIESVPALSWLIGFAALACLSLIWSSLPSVSSGKLRSDLVLPLLSYLSAFCWTRQGGAKPIFYGLGIGLILLTFCSVVELVPHRFTDGWPGLDPDSAGGQSHAHVYPGVGDASAYAILIIAPLLVWKSVAGRWHKTISILLAFAALVVILVSKNRDSLVLFPFGLVLFAALRARRETAPIKRIRLRFWLVGGFAMLVTALLLLELVSEQRLEEAHLQVPFGRAAMVLLSLDPRPQMWWEFIQLGMAHPWLGVGYGRTVPAAVYSVAHDPVLIAAHANMFEHAHDFLLNVWLQLGMAGLTLVAAASISCTRAALPALRESPLSALAAAGVLTLLTTTCLRNSIDDFLVYSMASTFWITLGLLFGVMHQPVIYIAESVAD